MMEVLPPSSSWHASHSWKPAQVVRQVSEIGGNAVDAGGNTSAAEERPLPPPRLLSAGETEPESLRSTVAAQGDQIVRLTRELQVARDSESKLRKEVETARQEVACIMEELRAERAASRAQAAAAAESITEAARLAAANAAAAGGEVPRGSGAGGRESPPPAPRGGGPSRHDEFLRTLERSASARSAAGAADDGGADGGGWRGSASPAPRPSSNRRSADTPVSATMLDRPPSSGSATSSGPAKDDIDERLSEFLQSTKCGISFRRLNRGWYAFRRVGDRGRLSNDRTVEVCIINSKLMARLEPSTHDPGWNNGKFGPIERFVARYSMVAQ